MVKEISEASINIVADVDLSPVEEDFLDRVAQSKGEEESPADIESEAAHLSHIQYLLSTSNVYGGGAVSTDMAHNKNVGVQKSLQSNELHQWVFNDRSRRGSILAPASTAVSSMHELQQAISAEIKKRGQQAGVNELKLTDSNKVASPKQSGEPDTNVTGLAAKEKAILSDAELVMAGNSPLTLQSDKERRQSAKTAEMIPVDIAISQRSDTSTRGEKVQVPSEALHKHMPGRTSTISVGKADAVNQSMDLKYRFQSWSGDHSVKVSVSPETRGAGNIILHPSDPRAADALTKQAGSLAGYTPDIVQPRQDREEREQQNRKREPQEDEQE
ncbi:SpaN/EivJ family type III secretion system needle length determinant [Erwinia tasmaniensis]|uniref:SpaN/EivJ family type III secretion system needle length determinant n=1 Tax=Erwinia tasmaniensis TaxID=338565 RepID=UPI0002FD6678|nr:hypothetical protein [Erwinia tasmaniensis]